MKGCVPGPAVAEGVYSCVDAMTSSRLATSHCNRYAVPLREAQTKKGRLSND